MALILSLLWWKRGWWDRIIILVITTGGAYLLDTLLKLFFQRARPDIIGQLIVEQGYSFPANIFAFNRYHRAPQTTPSP